MSTSIQGGSRRTLSPAERATALSVSLRGKMIDRLDQIAAERGISRSNLVVAALADYLDRETTA